MSKLKKRAPNIIKECDLKDRWQRGDLIVVEERDEERPKNKITRLRRKDFLQELLSRQIITKEQYKYGTQYAILYEKAGGATQDSYAKISLLSVSRNRWEHTQAQHEAYGKLFEIWEGMGKLNIIILNMVTLQDMNASKISEMLKQDRRTISGMIKIVFDSLENIFEKLENSPCTM